MEGSRPTVAVVGRLATRALTAGDLLPVFRQAVEAVADRLGAEHATVLETVEDGSAVRIRAGVGWRGTQLGETIDAAPGGHVAFVLGTTEPVVSDDLAAESRFRPSPQLLAQGVRSSIAVRIPSASGPTAFGIVAAHRTRIEPFDATDAAFLEAVGAVLALAIARRRAAFEAHDAALQRLVMASYALKAGDVAVAQSEVAAALTSLRHSADETLGEQPLPGDLRRD